LNKTKVEKVVDHEQERVERIKKETAVRRALANEQVRLFDCQVELVSQIRRQQRNAELELARQREADKAARSWDLLDQVDPDEEEGDKPQKTRTVRELEDDFM
jgi:hypothetical protein